MKNISLNLILLFFILLSACNNSIELTEGVVLNESVKITEGDYSFTSSTLEDPALVISGNDLVIDFQGATILGDTNYYAPDQFTGLAIKVENGRNITIKNLNIKGFKVGLLAENIPGLTLENCDFSYNYRPRLKSCREREDLSDWLSYHDNEEDQWLRFGSGIYLKNCDRAIIKDNIITQNQNALLMVGCDSSQVYNNVFTFNSGLGIGAYRSSHNTIMHNCLDFNVRGYSHGFYRRGQDSAGALFYEQCSGNTFAYNSATHSGDGFFLWAGNTTMDSGEGGCNDNLIAYNDFSYAPTNGIEVTFSSNIIIGNTMVDCRYGIWGGYSYDTYISDNIFERNNYGVAIEHGNNNTIVNNDFNGDEIGIQLWEREVQPADWGFANQRDVRSRDYRLGGNTFTDIDQPYDIRNTSDVDTAYIDDIAMEVPARLEQGLDAIGLIDLEGRDKILVNEWGPYNYTYPLIWLSDIRGDTIELSVLGPDGRWEIASQEGFHSFAVQEGETNSTLLGIRNKSADLLTLELKYQGEDFIDQHGVPLSGDNHVFKFSRYEKSINWDVRWYTFEDISHPLQNYEGFKGLASLVPHHQESPSELAYTWWRSPGGDVHPDRFGTFARGIADFTPGKYLIQVTSDDGLKLYVDGKLLIDHWDIHVPATDSLEIDLEGRHTFEIEHFEGGGFSTLDFRIEPFKQIQE